METLATDWTLEAPHKFLEGLLDGRLLPDVQILSDANQMLGPSQIAVG
jgi:hypothetical protein